MAKIRGAIVVDKDKCKGCELCVVSCPSAVIAMSPNVNRKGYRYATMDKADACTGCANCAIVCPDGVITVYKKKFEN
jgi:2-oxoglutarate ferredoxin oxidoreductase subunit delta